MRAVAYKVYHRPKQDREQLLRECTIAVRFAGPWTVGIYDADPEQGWIALEWVAGGSIRDCLVNKRFDTLRPLRVWARALAQALASVHSKGYVHADLKPANILLRDSHTPILTDFGIAAEQGTAPKGGSRGYLSPERLAGAALTPSDDVYAFGRVLEDVWQQTGQAPSTVYLDLIASCLSSKSERPKDGAELVTRLEQSGAD
jgi:serine/threonine-protein kinase